MGRLVALVTTQHRGNSGTTEQDKAGSKTAVTGWRRWLPWALVVLAAIIGLVSSLNVWVKRQALSTDNWTQASSQLLANPEIRNALSVYLVNQIYDNVNVSQALAERLPPAADGLAVPLAAALREPAIRSADALLARPRVQTLWKEANRRAHQRLIAVLDGNNQLLQSTNGNVVLDLRALLQQLTQRAGFGSRVAEKLPPGAGQIVIMKGTQLDTARRAVKVIRALSWLLFLLVLGLFALAVYLAPGRRSTILVGVGVSTLLIGLIVLVVRRYAGDYLVNALTSSSDSKAPAEAAWGIATSLLRNVGINLVVYGSVVAFGAWVAGPSHWASSLRRVSAPTMREHPAVIYGVVAVGLLIILVTGPTDAQRIYPLLVLFALAFVGTEVLRRQTLREFPVGRPGTASAG
jgi:hypothetical protein